MKSVTTKGVTMKNVTAKRKALAGLLSLLTLCGVLCGCGAGASSQTPGDADSVAASQAGDADTVAASPDNPRNQDGIGTRELLVVSFGTSYNDARRLSIGGVEAALTAAFPDWSVRRAFTSQIVLDHVRERDGVAMDNVTDALDRAAANGVTTLAVQPTHLMSGFEYQELAEEIRGRAATFDAVSIGAPLLTSDEDFRRVADAVTADTAEYNDGETAVCLMGHGTEAASNGVYEKIQTFFPEHYYVGTVEASPSVEDVLSAVRAGGYRKVVLSPLMIVAGDHAHNDMAGDDAESWKSVFESAGYEVTCLLRGLGELEAVQALFIEHAQAAIDALEPSQTADASATSETSDTSEASEAAQASETSPVYAADLTDGVYSVTVDSSSSMFRVTDCALTVSGDTLSATMTMGGTGYLYVYPGSASDAESVPESDYISYVENADGAHTFTIPVAALNTGVPCAAYSKNRERWYDRTLYFRADSLPSDAFAESVTTHLPDAFAQSATPDLSVDANATPDLSDGDYTIEVTLDGGSGRASITSPAPLSVRDGVCSVVITWSSPYYDYMKVNGEQYLPVNADGNSTFEIPVTAFDRPLNVFADTTAMSQPHEIEYALTFHSDTVRAA